MKPYKTKKIEASLQKKGFEVREGAKHKICTLYIGGLKTSIHTFISRGVPQYGDSLVGKMRKQLKLSPKEFEGVIACPISKEDLIKIYAEKEDVI